MRKTTLIAVLGLTACSGASGQATIGDIQGSGASSPVRDQHVSITGIVSGDFQNADDDQGNNLGGFFLQDETPDGDPQTSDGIFVFDGPSPRVDVQPGDKVRVDGKVQEHFGETQIAASRVSIVGKGTVTPADVSLPASNTVSNDDGDDIADLERYEGMLLRFPQDLYVTALHDLERYGNVQLAAGARLQQFTNMDTPNRKAYEQHRRDVAARSILLDDGRRDRDPSPLRLLDAGKEPAYSLRAGDAVAGVTGNLRYSRGSGGSGFSGWRLMPTEEPQFESRNPRPPAPDLEGELQVASFNLLNFFTTLDNNGNKCGPKQADSCRGADNRDEFERQLRKSVTTLKMIDADIVGLNELENNDAASLQLLVAALNAAAGRELWSYIDTGTIDTDAIKTGFIYKQSTVRPVGKHRLLDNAVDPDFGSDDNRPALAQTFALRSNDARLTVVLNHLKSKGSDCDDKGDRNSGDGQGNCARTRTGAARAIVNWLQQDPTGSNDEDFLIIGDLNSYLKEAPLQVFADAGYENQLLRFSDDTPYSFVWDGQAGALDHALASRSLAAQVRDAMEWHINADEPAVYDYNLSKTRDAALFDPDTPYRTSDHDPVIIGIDLEP
ncbi:MAG: ExeM/NucH family extracellular endonuclease [Woeseiaceae bacterium]